MNDRVLVVIPARLRSSRLPGKLLGRIGPRSLLEWTWRAARQAGYPVVIATDADEIEAEANRFGARAVRTPECQNGTERCAAALALVEEAPEIVVNWQGDSPCVPARVAKGLVDALLHDLSAVVTTPVRLVGRLEPGQSAVAMRLVDHRALYFTRQPVPTDGPYWAHVGLYCYRTAALRLYGTEVSPLEQAERLEQNRWLEQHAVVRCVPFDQIGECPEVNEPGDVARVARELGVEA